MKAKLLLLLAAFTTLAQAYDDSHMHFEKVTMLICNLEIKKMFVKRTKEFGNYSSRSDWPQLLKKIISITMRRCAQELNDVEKVQAVLSSVDKEDVGLTEMDFIKEIDIDQIAMGPTHLTAEEMAFYKRYQESDEEVQRTQARNKGEDVQHMERQDLRDEAPADESEL